MPHAAVPALAVLNGILVALISRQGRRRRARLHDSPACSDAARRLRREAGSVLPDLVLAVAVCAVLLAPVGLRLPPRTAGDVVRLLAFALGLGVTAACLFRDAIATTRLRGWRPAPGSGGR